MAEATALYLKTILEHKDIGQKMKKFFGRYFRDIDEAAKRLPMFLEVQLFLQHNSEKCCKGESTDRK